MAQLFSAEYWLLWAVVLAAALFFPARNLIWVLYVRRATAKSGSKIGDAEKARLRVRASVTAGLICAIFALLYTRTLFGGGS